MKYQIYLNEHQAPCPDSSISEVLKQCEMYLSVVYIGVRVIALDDSGNIIFDKTRLA